MKLKNRIGMIAFVMLAAICVNSLFAGELVVVKDGVSLAPVVIFKDAPPLTRAAAEELIEYIEKTSGAKPTLIEGEPKPTPERAIWVGYQPKLRELFPKIDFDFKHPEEILIAANDSHLVIAGRDVWDPEGLVIEGRRGKKIVGKQQEFGTANAVYTFLQDYLGVRWLWPGELGEDVLKRKTIAFAPFQYRYHAAIVVPYCDETGTDPRTIDTTEPNDYTEWFQYRAGILTGFMRRLRAEVREQEARLGRPCPIVARVPDYARWLMIACGLDIETWFADDLIDEMRPQVMALAILWIFAIAVLSPTVAEEPSPYSTPSAWRKAVPKRRRRRTCAFCPRLMCLLLIAAVCCLHQAFGEARSTSMVFVRNGQAKSVCESGGKWTRTEGYLTATGKRYLYAGRGLGDGDFQVRARLSLDRLNGTAAAFLMDGNQFGFEGRHGKMFVQGPVFGKSRPIADPREFIAPSKPFDLVVARRGKRLSFRIDGKDVWAIPYGPGQVRLFGLRPWRARMRVYEFSATGRLIEAALPKQSTMPKKLTIPTIDISGETPRHVIVAAGTETDYRGQVNTVLMADGKTMFAVWSIGHGGKCGPMKRSNDGGLTWSDMIPTPKNWREVGSCPCIFRLTDPQGVERLFVFAGRPKHYRSMSLDEGKTWTPMAWTGLYKPGGNTAVIPIDDGRKHLLLMQRGPVNKPLNESTQSVWQAVSSDGGLTWDDYRKVCEVPGAVPCEPELVRSPDGRQLACLMRENSRRLNSLVMFSDDEGRTWSDARELPASLTGDRHMSCYAPDGRLAVVFRDRAQDSPTYGHFVAWVGVYDDVRHRRPGQYRIKLLHSHAGPDCGYSGLERLPDGALVATTYIKYRPGRRKHSIVSVRFRLDETDAAARQPKDRNTATPSKG